MIINLLYEQNFLKHFRKRIDPQSKLDDQFQRRVRFFKANPNHPLLHDHPLKGSRFGERAFSISGDIRVIYKRIDEETVMFIDIGSHNQVYR